MNIQSDLDHLLMTVKSVVLYAILVKDKDQELSDQEIEEKVFNVFMGMLNRTFGNRPGDYELVRADYEIIYEAAVKWSYDYLYLS